MTSFCEPCSRVDKTAAAIKYCTECEEEICADCVTVHRAFKAFTSHHLLDCSMSASKDVLSIDRNCPEHADMLLDFYCSDHDSLCCRTCMAGNHRTCGQILPVTAASKGIKNSVLLDDTSKELTSMTEILKQLIDDRNQNGFHTNQQKSVILKEIDDLKDQIINRVVHIEEDIKSEVDSTTKELAGKYEADLIKVHAKQDAVKATQEQINLINEHGSESQMFVLLHTMKNNISKQSNELQEFITSLNSPKISFNPNKLTTALDTLDSLGSVLVELNPCSVSFQSSKQTHAQTEHTENRVPYKFKFDRKFKVNSKLYGRISSIAVTNDSRLLVCFNRKNSVSSWTEMGEHLQDCTLASEPWGIVTIPVTSEAVVSLPNKSSIQFLNTTDMKTGKLIVVPSASYGITVINDRIVLGAKGQVYFINRVGHCLQTIDVESDFLRSLCTGRGEAIYCCQPTTEPNLICINHDGATIFTYSSPSCDGPIGVTSDARGNLYVTAWKSNSLLRMSPDGQLSNIILKKEDGLNAPCGVAFNMSYTKMFIGSNFHDGNGVLIFNCAFC